MALTPGERITLIKRCGAALGKSTWSEIDLTLRQFSMPWSEQWHGNDPYDYAVEHLEGADDGKLVDLHAYLYPDATTEPALDGAGPWQEGHFRLFLSHASEHREAAAELRSSLARYGIDAFVAHDDIEPSQQWMNEIESALGTCDALVAFLTPEFVTSKWCDQEVGFCLARGVVIVPVRMDTPTPHGFISKFQALNGRDKPNHRIANEIFRTLAAHEVSKDKMAQPIVRRFVNSGSYDGAREGFDLLKTIPAEKWTDELVEQAEVEAFENRQISEAFDISSQQAMSSALKDHLDRILGRRKETPTLEAALASDDDIPF